MKNLVILLILLLPVNIIAKEGKSTKFDLDTKRFRRRRLKDLN